MEIFWSWLPFTSLLPRYTYNLAKNLLIIFVFLLLVLSCLAVWKVRKNSLRVSNSYSGLTFAGLMTVFTAAYMLILGFSYIFSDPPTSVYRILLPVQIVVVIGFFSPIFLSIGISISYLHDSIKIVSQYHQNGGGYTSQYARSSPTIHEVEQIPLNIPLISNESALVLFYTGRPAYDISELLDREPQVITNRYGDDPNDPAQKAFRETGGALVLFKSSIWQFEQLYGKQATSRLEYFVRDLSLYKQAYDGAIYFYPSTGLP
jgi:hypothetical protein